MRVFFFFFLAWPLIAAALPTIPTSIPKSTLREPVHPALISARNIPTIHPARITAPVPIPHVTLTEPTLALTTTSSYSDRWYWPGPLDGAFSTAFSFARIDKMQKNNPVKTYVNGMFADPDRKVTGIWGEGYFAYPTGLPHGKKVREMFRIHPHDEMWDRPTKVFNSP